MQPTQHYWHATNQALPARYLPLRERYYAHTIVYIHVTVVPVYINVILVGRQVLREHTPFEKSIQKRYSPYLSHPRDVTPVHSNPFDCICCLLLLLDLLVESIGSVPLGALEFYRSRSPNKK